MGNRHGDGRAYRCELENPRAPRRVAKGISSGHRETDFQSCSDDEVIAAVARWRSRSARRRTLQVEAMFSAAPIGVTEWGARCPSCFVKRAVLMERNCSPSARDSSVRPPSPAFSTTLLGSSVFLVPLATTGTTTTMRLFLLMASLLITTRHVRGRLRALRGAEFRQEPKNTSPRLITEAPLLRSR